MKNTFSPKTDAKAILLGGKCKNYLSVGRVAESDYKDYDVRIDSDYPHVCFICGRRGSGKVDLGLATYALGTEDGTLRYLYCLRHKWYPGHIHAKATPSAYSQKS